MTSFAVGCSLGRGAGDEWSDVDAVVGVGGDRSEESVALVAHDLAAVVATFGGLVDTLRRSDRRGEDPVRWLFAQYADATQLDVAVVPDRAVRVGDAAPDFVSLFGGAQDGAAVHRPAYGVSDEELHGWAFDGWIALADLNKYLRRGSLFEAHARLELARAAIWRLWAASKGAAYPWHGLSQVLDHDADDLPPGIDSTVAVLGRAALHSAAIASAGLLERVGDEAAHTATLPGGVLREQAAAMPSVMGAYVTGRLVRDWPEYRAC